MIEVEHLTKRYGPVTAVDDLTFRVEPGVVTGFLGPNGAGKSTTMRMILGLDRPTAGTATIAGRDYGTLTHPVRTVGALLDANWVHPNRSARSHLRWIAAGNRIPVSRVDAVLDQVGLTAVAKRRAGTFSLGMRQRLGIAAALLGEPEVLILDEPVNGLDPDGIQWLRRLLRDFAGDGGTVLLSSHLLAEMANTVDQVIVLGRGKLITQQSITAFLGASTGRQVSVRVDAPERLHDELRRNGLDFRPDTDGDGRPVTLVDGTRTDDVGELARAAGCTVWELAARSASLEEAFMKATDEAVQFRGPATPEQADGRELVEGTVR